ncbi:MAG: diacylglycerol kinase family lipid kinase [Treponema sp.]|nr:diacylglycerol kinase family lipid kinase [Treponema sp.]
MEKRKIWVILNPTAGKGKARKRLRKIERYLESKNCNFQIHTTKETGHAIDIVRNLPIGDNDITIAAGGDGTVNEVVNGLLTRRPRSAVPPLFGIIPVGRGNDFSSTPGIPENTDQALSYLLEGKVRPLDVGLVKGGFFPDGRYFVNGIGIGFDTKVGFEAAKMKIKSGISYTIGALITLIRYEPSPVIQMKYDDKEVTLAAVIISIVNGRRMGGSFYMGPNALLDDGLFDICYVRHQEKRSQLLDIFSHYKKGTQAECQGVYTGKAAKFEIKALEGGMAVHCDGETVCYDGKELEVSCVPSALRLIGP